MLGAIAGIVRGRIVVVAVTGMICAFGGPAFAYSEKVENACRDDYFRLCSGYPLGSASLRLCMESKSKDVSRSCVTALISAGEVDRRRMKRGY
jgi:hypothetical protein